MTKPIVITLDLRAGETVVLTRKYTRDRVLVSASSRHTATVECEPTAVEGVVAELLEEVRGEG
jgi:hypothetical protein